MKKKTLEAICIVCGGMFLVGFVSSNIGWFSIAGLMGKSDEVDIAHNYLMIIMSSVAEITAFVILLIVAALPLFLKDNRELDKSVGDVS